MNALDLPPNMLKCASINNSMTIGTVNPGGMPNCLLWRFMPADNCFGKMNIR